MRGPCIKQRVFATLISPEGFRFYGENDCANPQTICPRSGMGPSIGYHLCWEVCEQESHAEVSAIKKAGSFARGSTIYVEGHNYICDNCLHTCSELNINVLIGIPPE